MLQEFYELGMEYEWSYSFLSIRLVGQSDWVEAELASADAVLSAGTLYIEWWMTRHIGFGFTATCRRFVVLFNDEDGHRREEADRRRLGASLLAS